MSLPAWSAHLRPGRTGRFGWSGLYGQERPGPRHALQLVLAALAEGQPGADDEVGDGARHEHLSWTGQRRHPGADVDGHPADVLSQQFDLARVQAGPHLDAELGGPVAYGTGALDGPCRSVERRQEAVADGLDLAAGEIGR